MKKNKKLNFLIIIFASIFLFSTVLAVNIIIRENKEKTNQENLLSQKQQWELDYLDNKDNQYTIDDSINRENAAILNANNELYKQNSDYIGWLQIEDTTINYPVMYTPNDYDYYLRKNFNKEYALSGELFVGLNCTIDNPKFNTIIYGHNMHNHTMFTDLQLYASEDYYTQHQYIKFDTLNENRTYQIFAVFKEQLSQNDTFDYYNYIEYSPAFITKVNQIKLYDTNIDINKDDKILTLSTCDNYALEGRFVILAKQIK